MKKTLKTENLDEFVALRSKCYASKCGNGTKNKLKGISKSFSRNINNDEYYNCLLGEDYQQEDDNYIIRSLDHELYLQQLKKTTLSIIDNN